MAAVLQTMPQQVHRRQASDEEMLMCLADLSGHALPMPNFYAVSNTFPVKLCQLLMAHAPGKSLFSVYKRLPKLNAATAQATH